MRIKIENTIVLGAEIKSKPEKQSEGKKVDMTHLKFSELTVQHDVFDDIIGAPIGFTRNTWFDEMFAPICRQPVVLSIPVFRATLDGAISGFKEGEHLRIRNATIKFDSVNVRPEGVELSGELTWPTAGDETTDSEPLRGYKCAINWVLTEPDQSDLVSMAHENAKRAAANIAQMQIDDLALVASRGTNGAGLHA